MKAERSVLVCFPLKQEAAPFRKIAAEKSGVDILLTGIGRRKAEQSLRKFLSSCRSRGNEAQIKNQSETPHVVSYEPGLVLACGFAGGLNPDLKLGDVIFECGMWNAECGTLAERLAAVGAKPAKFFCAGRIATTAAEKKNLRDETGADAVEMESAAVYAVCREHNIPCATVRVISDTASEDLPLDFNQLSRPDQSLDYGKLFLAIAKSPGKIRALMKLQKQTQFAAERLAQVLARIL
jgi:adenosylhomocysteine nucleosidase